MFAFHLFHPTTFQQRRLITLTKLDKHITVALSPLRKVPLAQTLSLKTIFKSSFTDSKLRVKNSLRLKFEVNLTFRSGLSLTTSNNV